jgi:hypothetical protein
MTDQNTGRCTATYGTTETRYRCMLVGPHMVHVPDMAAPEPVTEGG